jgi:hypothetical protein
MAITFVAAGAKSSIASGTTQTPGNPAGIAVNDILLINAACWDSGLTASMVGNQAAAEAGTGWHELIDQVDSAGSGQGIGHKVYWCRYNGSVPSAQITWSGSGDGKLAAMTAWRGVKTTGLPYNVLGSVGGSADSTAEHASVTTTVTDCMLVMFGGVDVADAVVMHASFATAYEDANAGTDNSYRGNSLSIWCHYLIQAASGASGIKTVTGVSTSGGGWGSVMLALQPAVAAILAADAGSYALTGSTATLRIARKIAADAGSYTLSGQTVGLRRNLPLLAASGSYALTGSTASLFRGREIQADAGSYTLNGQTVTLQRKLPLVAGVGSYAVTGSTAALRITHLMSAAAGSYALSGSTAALRIGYEVAATAGSYTLNGSDATLTLQTIADPILVPDPGSYAVTGSTASLEYGRLIAAASGSYAVTGQVATFQTNRRIEAVAGSYAVTGSTASLLMGRILTAAAGAYALTGQTATLKAGHYIAAAAGSYATTGSPATLLTERRIAANSGSYTLTGSDTTLTVSAVGGPSEVPRHDTLSVGITVGL